MSSSFLILVLLPTTIPPKILRSTDPSSDIASGNIFFIAEAPIFPDS